MDFRLLFRFHLVPTATSVAAAVRQGPLVAGVAGFLAVSLVGLTLAGNPLVKLPGEVWPAAAQFVALTAAGAALVWLVGRRARERWRSFFEVQPRGPRAWLVYLAGQALGSWAAAALVMAGLSGPGFTALGAAGAAALPFTAVAVALGRRHPRAAVQNGSMRRFPGLPAWWVSRPLLFLVPFAAWAGLMAWAVSGGAGFVWATRPPVVDLLSDFGWTVVFGLLWSEASAQVPYAYFRLARAPFRRVLLAVGAPVAGATLVVLVALAFLTGSPGGFFRAAGLTVAGTLFWFFVWLRWGPASLAHLMLFITLFLVGAAAEKDWWVLWAVVQIGAAAAVGAGWRTRYYEGDTHAGN